jgi:hypothetical protein
MASHTPIPRGIRCGRRSTRSRRAPRILRHSTVFRPDTPGTHSFSRRASSDTERKRWTPLMYLDFPLM